MYKLFLGIAIVVSVAALVFLVGKALQGQGVDPGDRFGDGVGAGTDDSLYVNEPRSVDRLLSTENVKTTIDLGEVLSGGVGKDGIPPIDEPLVVTIDEVPAWMDVEGDGILIERDGQARFYPYQVLVRHEIVNDTFAGEDILVTYCPLCFTGVVFDPTVNGEPVEFGVSGKLWESNLLMYNRSDPESLWSQALGEAVVGPAAGQALPIVRFDITQYGKFVESFPDGEVVIGDAQSVFPQSYAGSPYGGDLRNIEPIFPFSGDDDRLEKTDIVLGLVYDGESRAYLVSALERDGRIADGNVEVVFNQSTGVAEFYDRANDRARLTPIPSFWISWVSVHPDTQVYK